MNFIYIYSCTGKVICFRSTDWNRFAHLLFMNIKNIPINYKRDHYTTYVSDP